MKVPFLDLQAEHTGISEILSEAAKDVIDSGWYVLGEKLLQFEAEWAHYCRSKHAIGVGSGLDALELILRGYGIGVGDEVVVPANTYIASWLAISNVGATPVAAAPRTDDFNLDPESASECITPRTRAIMAVHLYGQPASMVELREIADQNGLILIEDAAQAHGAALNGRRVGCLGDAAAFSFYPTKNLGALGDGGIVTTDDDGLADRVRLMRNYGSRNKYHNEIVGTNSRLDEIQAAILLAKLPHLERWNSRRTAIAQRYLIGLEEAPLLTLPSERVQARHVWHVFTIRSEVRDNLADQLGRSGVGTLVFYPIPPHKSGAYASQHWISSREGLAERTAERLADTVLSLPIGPSMTDGQVDYVITMTLDALSRLC